MELSEMTDGQLRRELACTEEHTQRYDDLMEELEGRMIFRNSRRTAGAADMLPRSEGWHSSTDKCEGM